MDAKTTYTVLAEVAGERERQDEKWGVQNHEIYKWLSILGEEVGEANEAALEMSPEIYSGPPGGETDRRAALRKELIQVAAVAVCIVEWIDRTEFKLIEEAKKHTEQPE